MTPGPMPLMAECVSLARFYTGPMLSPADLEQIKRMVVHEDNLYALPPDIEVSIEDVERLCRRRRSH
jgi:hypothetical protein